MTVGVLGGGQLGRMLGLAGIPMGLRFSFYDPARDACAREVGEHVCADWNDAAALHAFAADADVVTLEFENVPLVALDEVASVRPVLPTRVALESTQDRLREKETFKRLDIPTPAFATVDDEADLRAAAAALGYPLVLKSRTGGYDGKGQVLIRNQDEREARYAETRGQGLIAEAFVPFRREVSVVAVRSAGGEARFYDLAENVHAEGILRTSRNKPGDARQGEAEALVSRLMEHLDYVGVLALELFDDGERLLANEYAPRVHNTGHWTIEGAVTSQFENHVRAVVGWPLGDTASVGLSEMTNLIGENPLPADVLVQRGAHYHWYGKEPRPGRKVGHVTVVR